MDNHYRTLGLAQRQYDGNLTSDDIRRAYRHALLQHHPDKTSEVPGQLNRGVQTATSTPTGLTVDAITVAYKTLSEPTLKAEYDRALRLSQARDLPGEQDNDKVYYSGLDIVDLDDLGYDDRTSSWWKACRCGQDRGFVILEDDLERVAQHGELFTGCRGCSLWLKVLFHVDGGGSAGSATNET